MDSLLVVGGLAMVNLLILNYLYLRRFKRVTERLEMTVIYNKLVEVTLVLDTNAYAQNDILSATAEIPGGLPTKARAILDSIHLIDKAKNNAAINVMILKSNTAVGAANAAEAMSDAVATEMLTIVPIVANDYTSNANWSYVTKTASAGDTGMGVVLAGDKVGASNPIYIASKIVDASAKTYAADSIVIQLGLTITQG